MKPEYDALLRSTTQNSLWEYKGKQYRVFCTMPGFLTQDPETGDWAPTVSYRVAKETRDTQVIGSLVLQFGRAITEFNRKFKRIVED